MTSKELQAARAAHLAVTEREHATVESDLNILETCFDLWRHFHQLSVLAINTSSDAARLTALVYVMNKLLDEIEARHATSR